MNASLLIRADADAHIGTGHVMRCLGLAQAWQQDGGSVAFAVVRRIATPLEERLRADACGVHSLEALPGSNEDAVQTVWLARELRSAAVVLDGYEFDADYQRCLKAAGLRVLCIDDNGHATHYAADWVLNQNIHANPALYPSREPYTRLLLGTAYVLLRREFARWRGWVRIIPPHVRRVLVALGGGDAENVTLKVTQALQELVGKRRDLSGIPAMEAQVVVGGANPHWQSLKAALQGRPGAIRLVRHVKDMPGMMAWADLAVTAGGSTCWEVAFLGLPSCVLVSAENQVASVARLHGEGVAQSLGWASGCSADRLIGALEGLVDDPDRRRDMSERGRSLVDGRGAERVVGMVREALSLERHGKGS